MAEKCVICGKPISNKLKKFDFDETNIVACVKCMAKPFEITTVCRADLLMESFTPEEVVKFNDVAMGRLARQIGESTTGEAGTFWEVLDDYGHELLEDL